MKNSAKKQSAIKKIGKLIPDPVIIFIFLYAILLIVSLIFGGREFTVSSYSGDSVYRFRYMFTAENIRWIFSNAILNNWLAYGNGILGTILVVMLGIGVAEESGLLSALIRKMGASVSKRLLPYMLVFIGVMTNIAADVGYLVLIPLAGMLYASIGKNPLVGMAASFAGVSAGFSANLIPANFADVVIGINAKTFADSQGIPFISYLGKPLNAATMNYYFFAASSILLIIVGGLITTRITERKYPSISITNTYTPENMELTKKESSALKWALVGFLISIVIIILLAVFPLAPYTDANGNTITPYIDNIILLVTFSLFLSGVFYGFASKKFNSSSDVVSAMAKQMGSMGYVIVLTFFCYNFLSLLSYTNADIFITGAGVSFIQKTGLSHSPILLIIGVILITSIINLFVGGMTAKWMLLGPIFIPMLYSANNSVTPEVVSAAYRLADSCTNTITPLMTYAGVILMYMRRYKKDFTIGNLISMMAPYSAIFLVSWSSLLLLFIGLKIPLGF